MNNINFNSLRLVIMMLCAIWYHLLNFKKVENTHGEVLLLVIVAGFYPVTLLKVKLRHQCFSCFLNYANDTKAHSASQIFFVFCLFHTSHISI